MKIYVVRQAVWGSDRRENHYFPTKEEANKYYDDHNYCDFPYPLCVADKRARELLLDKVYSWEV